MSFYTISVKEIIEQKTQYVKEHLSVDEKIALGKSNIFDFSYPFWNNPIDEWDTKDAFETRFCEYFYMKEIGVETIEMFKLRLKAKLRLCMDDKILLHNTLVKDYDFLQDVDLYEDIKDDTIRIDNTDFSGNAETIGKLEDDIVEHNISDSNRSENIEDTQTGSSDRDSKNLNSELPQHTVVVGSVDIYGERYIENEESINSTNHDERDIIGKDDQTIDNLRNQDQDTKTDVSSKSITELSSDTDHTRYLHRHGLNGNRSYQDLIKEYRENIINIFDMIMEECEELFMLIY